MLLHASVEARSVVGAKTVEHLVVGLDLAMALSDDSAMDQNKSVLISATIEHSNGLNMILKVDTLRGEKVVVVILKDVWVRVVEKLPIAQSITIAIL